LPDFPLVDAHVHLYDPDLIAYSWMADIPLLNSLHGSAEYSEAIGGVAVEKLVFVEVDAGPGVHLDEAKWVEAAAERDPRIQGIVATVPLENGPESVAADLAAVARMPLARGVRRLIQGHVDEPGWCLRDPFVEAVRLLAQLGLSFDICIYHPQMADAIELVRRCPEVSFILDHIGKPGIKRGLRDPWWTRIREMAGLPNVICKISGVVTEADEDWTYDQVAPYVAHAIESFGFDRVAFGGDWPVLELAGRYPEWVKIVDRVTAGASAAELRKLYRDNAVAFYRL
jgi:predicted TIM-barrel fold metal-dependent hydrolase